jgi:hypothetical protein
MHLLGDSEPLRHAKTYRSRSGALHNSDSRIAEATRSRWGNQERQVIVGDSTRSICWNNTGTQHGARLTTFVFDLISGCGMRIISVDMTSIIYSSVVPHRHTRGLEPSMLEGDVKV